MVGVNQRVVADACYGPHVVQGPYYFFARFQNGFNLRQRQHPLVNPMQVNEVGFPKFRRVCDGMAGIGDGNIEKMPARKTILTEDPPAFGIEILCCRPFRADADNPFVASFFAANHHFGLSAAGIQGLHQSVSRNGCPSLHVRCTDNKYLHLLRKNRFIRLLIFACREKVLPWNFLMSLRAVKSSSIRVMSIQTSLP